MKTKKTTFARAFLLSIVLISLDVAALEIFTDQGNEFYQKGDFKEAVKAYRKGLAAGENPALIYFNLGNTYYNLGNNAKAVVSYDAAINEAPEFFRAYLNLGVLYFNLDDFAACVSVLEHGRTLEPFNTQCLLVLAASYRKLGSATQAIPLLELILTLDRSIDDAYFLLFDINREIEDFEESKKWLLAYPDKGKRVSDKYQLLADVINQTDGPKKAAPYYRKLVEVAPQLQWSHYYYVSNLAATGNKYSALEHAEAMIPKFKSFGNLCLLAGTIAFESKLYRKAEFFYVNAYARKSHDGLIGLQNIIKVYTSENDQGGVDRVNRLLLSVK